MTDIFGMKVSKQGYDVKTATDTQLNFDSRFDTLKIKQQNSGIINDTSRTITIAHNLGYVPAFTVHVKPTNYTDGYYICPIQVGQSFWTPEKNSEIFAWADEMNVYIKAQDDAGYTYATADDWCYDSWFYYQGSLFVGIPSWSDDKHNSGIRFSNVNRSGNVYKADLGLYITSYGAYSTPVKTVGIDEDNTGDFGGSPFGRSQTSASIQNTRDASIHDIWVYSITDIFNEIVSRGGWSSGNHMGFLLFDNGSTQRDTAFYGGTHYDFVRWMPTNKIADVKCTIYYNKIV
jgi:hypothetical protein